MRMPNPKNEIPIYNSHAWCQKERLQKAIPICILWIAMRMPNPKNEIPKYNSHARTQKPRLQKAIPICIL